MFVPSKHFQPVNNQKNFEPRKQAEFVGIGQSILNVKTHEIFWLI